MSDSSSYQGHIPRASLTSPPHHTPHTQVVLVWQMCIVAVAGLVGKGSKLNTGGIEPGHTREKHQAGQTKPGAAPLLHSPHSLNGLPPFVGPTQLTAKQNNQSRALAPTQSAVQKVEYLSDQPSPGRASEVAGDAADIVSGHWRAKCLSTTHSRNASHLSTARNTLPGERIREEGLRFILQSTYMYVRSRPSSKLTVQLWQSLSP